MWVSGHKRNQESRKESWRNTFVSKTLRLSDLKYVPMADVVAKAVYD